MVMSKTQKQQVKATRSIEEYLVRVYRASKNSFPTGCFQIQNECEAQRHDGTGWLITWTWGWFNLNNHRLLPRRFPDGRGLVQSDDLTSFLGRWLKFLLWWSEALTRHKPSSVSLTFMKEAALRFAVVGKWFCLLEESSSLVSVLF